MIISCLTRKFIVQVSDRRITRLKFSNDGKKIIGHETIEEQNKAVLYFGFENLQIAFSFTGLAEFQKVKTDLWLAKILAEPECQDPQIAVARVISKANDQFQKSSIPLIPHAFVGIGWTKEQSDENNLPFCLLISNFTYENGKITNLSRKFQINAYTLNDNHSATILVTGQPLFRHEYYELLRTIKVAINTDCGPQSITTLCAETIRNVSKRNDTVGKNLMVISLPLQAMKSGIINSGGEKMMFTPSAFPSKLFRSFYYLPESSNEEIEYGPYFSNCGMISDFLYCKDGETEIVSSRIFDLSLDKAKLSKNPPSDPYTDTIELIILSTWAGLGTFADPRQALLAKEYNLVSCSDLTGANSWLATQECPYYGVLVQAVVKNELVEKISKDKRFYILCKSGDKKTIIDANKVEELERWFSNHGMDDSSAHLFSEQLKNKSYSDIINILTILLRTPK